jgi:hypothetical protein
MIDIRKRVDVYEENWAYLHEDRRCISYACNGDGYVK